MTKRERYIFHVTVDISPEKEKEWNDWYDQIHIPSILKCPGFINVRRYRSVQGPGPRYLAIYEVEHERVLQSPEYNRARGWYQFAPFTIDTKPTIYKEIFYTEP